MPSRNSIVRVACCAGITIFIFACSPNPRSVADSAGGLVDSAGVPAAAAIGTDPGANIVMRNASGRDLGGAAVVIHAGADDNRTDPSGNSGDRIACGATAGR